MKILGSIHTYNEQIVGPLGGLLRQTHPVDGILVIDNASTAVLPKFASSNKVTLVRNPENLGVSGAVIKGIQYALEHDYDWIWVFDADGTPHDDALEKLMDL